jgi:signal transduction histidine kinase
MKRYLILKLLAIHLVVIGFVMIIVWLAIDTLAAGYFVTLMEKYNISPEPAHAMFVDAVHRYLLWACLAAVALAVVLSFVMMRRVLAPLSRMTVITRDIAAGNFAVRVPAETRDEVGQLARAFNRMAASLEALEKLRRSLMIDVAHELRTPLTNMRGYLEALHDGVLPPSRDTIALLQDETLRLVQLVEDVLQLARADAARNRLAPETLDLGVLVRETFETLAPEFKRRALTVAWQIPETPVKAVLDRRRMERVLRNLADNAARYSPAAGQVDVLLEASADQVHLMVANIAPELVDRDLPFIFERFYRGEKSRSREHGGAGIGLAIVRELVEAHGGQVKARRQADQLRIRLTLPRTRP